MRALGVTLIQGWVYSKAIECETLRSQLEAGTWEIDPSGPARHRSDRRSLYRKAGAILGGYYHPVLVRNLSESGAYIEGMIDVPIGTQIILDLGDCQLEVATVRRLTDRGHGIEFGQLLVSDGASGFCTAHRVAPYDLAKCGLSGSVQINEPKPLGSSLGQSVASLAAALGLAVPESGVSAAGDRRAAANGQGIATPAGSMPHHRVLELFASANPLQNLSLLNPGANSQRQLTAEEWERLRSAVDESHNPQLKYIVALVVLTGARFQELLSALWDDFDLTRKLWKVDASRSSDPRVIRVPGPALEIIEQLPRADDCEHLILNPRTKKPFNSVFGSWDAARKKAGLENISIHDLRKSIKRTW
jgi:hypothetical protein